MKIRILGNSLRLRLSIPEIEELSKHGNVSDQINFGQRQLKYSLWFSEVGKISASFQGDDVRISIPEAEGRQWVNSNQVGVSENQKLPDGEELRILVEKDFACLKPRTGENENELFPNPDAGQD